MSSEQYPNLPTRRNFIRQVSCAAVGTMALRSTIRDLRLINAAMAAASTPTDYKALVCLFLGGGNDANNWIVPSDTPTYTQYAGLRGVLALPQASLLTLRDGPGGSDPAYLDADGHNYGFHPTCPELRTLFGEGKLAVTLNVGTLVRPTTREQYLSGLPYYRPPQIFSHSDQVTQWQTSVPDQPPVTGWGGRVADYYNAAANSGGRISMSVSLAGANTFEVGNIISQYQVSSAGAVTLANLGSTAKLQTMKNILGLPDANLQRTAYADVMDRAIETGDLLNTNIAATADPTDVLAGNPQNAAAPWRWNTGLTGIYTVNAPVPAPTSPPAPPYDTSKWPTFMNGGFPTSSLGQQLKMIARLLAARGPSGFNMKRQIFFCSTGGFDTHTNQVTLAPNLNPTTGTHANLLNDISECMFAFQRAMEQLGISNEVTTFTASDFSRTLPTNSQGSDHGWGSHHMIVGGAVKGRKVYGHLPILEINGPNDTGLGRWLPTTAVDQHAATLARWFGVQESDLAMIFPNLSRFAGTEYGPNIGFMT